MDGQYEATPVDPDAIPRPRRAVEPSPSVPAHSRHSRLTVGRAPRTLDELIPRQRPRH